VIGSLLVVAVSPAVVGEAVNTSRLIPAAPSDCRLIAPPVTLVIPAAFASRIDPRNDRTLTVPVPASTVARVMSSPAPAACPALIVIALLFADVSTADPLTMFTTPVPLVVNPARLRAAVMV